MTIDDCFPYTFKTLCRKYGLQLPVSLGGTPKDDRSWIDETRSDDNDLCQEMSAVYGFSQAQVHQSAECYRLGRSRSGKTIYWLIDEGGRSPDGLVGSVATREQWVSTMLRHRYPEVAGYLRPEHCLFGQHLLGRSKGAQAVGLVESVRSAVILSVLRPEILWLAYVYPCNLTVGRLAPLRGRTVTLFPRTDPSLDTYLGALELADQARRCYPIDLRVSDFLEDHASDEQKARHIDILDYLYDS